MATYARPLPGRWISLDGHHHYYREGARRTPCGIGILVPAGFKHPPGAVFDSHCRPCQDAYRHDAVRPLLDAGS